MATSNFGRGQLGRIFACDATDKTRTLFSAQSASGTAYENNHTELRGISRRCHRTLLTFYTTLPHIHGPTCGRDVIILQTVLPGRSISSSA